MADRLRDAVDRTLLSSTQRARELATAKGPVTKKGDAQRELISALQAQVAQLTVEGDAKAQALAEAQADIAGLRSSMGGLRTELIGLREMVERVAGDLRVSAAQPLSQMRGELTTATQEVASLKAQVALLTSGLEVAQSTQLEHGSVLKDVAVLRAQQGFVQSAADRMELGSAEQGRILGELRAELGGLQTRHAALVSGSAAEHAAHRQAATGARSQADTLAMQVEAMQGQVAALHVSEAGAVATSEKLKKAAKRHELLVQRLSEVQEARAGELRGLIKSVGEQLSPLQLSSRRHASQIEELSSGINVLAELLRFNNRSRSATLADALHAL